MRARITLCAALLLFLFAGCGITPVPQPPSFDPSRLATREVVSSGDRVTISGDPGSANGTIYAINLDDDAPPATAEADDDGSFSLSLVVHDGDVVRMQARRALERSIPVDLEFVDGMIAVTPQSTGCVSAPVEIELGEVPAAEVSRAVLRVRSTCSDPVPLREVRVRLGDVIAVEDPPAALDEGETPIDLTLGAPPSGPFEDVVLVLPEDGSERLAISVFGVAR